MNNHKIIWTLDELVLQNKIKLGRGNIISKNDIAAFPGNFPIYSSAQEKNGVFGFYGKYMFDEELITWSVDGGGKLFYRHKHKFSVTNVGGTLRILDPLFLNSKYLYFVLTHLHSKIKFDWVFKAHPSVLRRVYNTIPIPSLESQLRIVEKLDKAYAQIDSLEKGIEQLQINIEKIESTLLLNLWDKHRNALILKELSEVANYENGKAHEKLIDENGDFKLVNSKFISTGGLKFKRTSEALSPLTKGEIAMVLSDVPNGKALAKCFLVDKDDVYSLNQRICKISSRVLIPEYLFINLNRNPYLLGFNNGENQTNLRLKDVLNTPIYFTDILTQELIVNEYKEQFTYINLYKANLAKKLNLLRELKQSVLGSEFSTQSLAA